MSGNAFPKLHNAMWPGLVGKGADSEPPIALDTMLELTAKARVDGASFDGVDLFLADPHISIDTGKDDIKRLADKIGGYGLAVGSLVAPVCRPSAAVRRWGPTTNASASWQWWRRLVASAGNCAISAFDRRALCGSIQRPA